MLTPLIECSNLSIGYKSSLKDGISFSLKEGELLHLKGRNGTGKTTLIRTLLKEIKPLKGELDWNVQGREVSYLPQRPSTEFLFSYNMQEILNIYDIPEELIGYIESSLLEKKWINSSGGEKQLVMILSRLTEKTKVLILDEPFNHLDEKAIATIKDLLTQLLKKVSIILVSHVDSSFSHCRTHEVLL